MSALNQSQASPVEFANSHVRTLRELALPQGVQMRQYLNAHERVYFEKPDFHTFSMYLQGGYQTRRTDAPAPLGEPGKFCLMPAGSYSAWHVGQEQNFVHVYFDDDYIKRLALQNFGVDPRRVALPQLTFESSETLHALLKHSVLNSNWSDESNRMLLHHSLQTMLLHLLETTGVRQIKTSEPLKAGLSPVIQNRLVDYIEANLHRQIYLQELADEAGLSEYHFARMFKISFTETPQNYINQRRVEKIQQYLTRQHQNGQQPLAQLALAFGFSSQSHMGRVFKQFTGITPRQFARACAGT